MAMAIADVAIIMDGTVAAAITMAGGITVIITGTERRKARRKPGFLRSSSLPLRAPPEAEGDHHGAASTNQVMAYCRWSSLRWTWSGPGFGMPLVRHRRFQIDIERRDRLAALAPAERARHCRNVAREPEALGNILRRRQRTPGSPGSGYNRSASTGWPVTSRPAARSCWARSCIVFCTKPALTATISPEASRAGRNAQAPGPVMSSRTAGAGAVDHRIRQWRIGRREGDAAEFILAGDFSALPLRRRRQRTRRGREPFGQTRRSARASRRGAAIARRRGRPAARPSPA